MPNRILKESICRSEDIDGLSWFEEVFFYRLLVNCDDYGRLDARPKILKSLLFPLKEGITQKQVSAALHKLSTAGLVQVYLYDQKPYLQLTAWSAHQNIRAKRSKYPGPGGEKEAETMRSTEFSDKSPEAAASPLAGACNCIPLRADVPVIQSESESESESISQSEREYARPPASARPSTAKPEDFSAFWRLYPRKTGKGKAKEKWEKAVKKADAGVILQGAQAFAAWCERNGEEPQFIPHPATWLNQERWEDVLVDKAAVKTAWQKAREQEEQEQNAAFAQLQAWAVQKQEKQAPALAAAEEEVEPYDLEQDW